MKTRIVEGVQGARTATGHVVVIDVLRAFTTAAYAFDAGIDAIDLVETVEEARALEGFRMGEVGGVLIPGFDHNNSPAGLIGRRLSGRAVQKTGHGTPCVVAAAATAQSLWLGSFAVAGATVRALACAQEVTFVVSGAPSEGEEDRAAALYMKALLLGEQPPLQRFVEMVRGSRAAARHYQGDPQRPAQDVDCAVAVDAFDFAMRVSINGRRLTATCV